MTHFNPFHFFLPWNVIFVFITATILQTFWNSEKQNVQITLYIAWQIGFVSLSIVYNTAWDYSNKLSLHMLFLLLAICVDFKINLLAL